MTRGRPEMEDREEETSEARPFQPRPSWYTIKETSTYNKEVL